MAEEQQSSKTDFKERNYVKDTKCIWSSGDEENCDIQNI